MKGLKAYILYGILFVSLLGTVLHFAYAWSGERLFVGLFTPINESIWEHTKLLFFPMTVFSLLPFKKTHAQYPCLRSGMRLGSLAGVFSIIIFFYTYSGILGFHTAAADISIFYISVILAFSIAYKRALSCKAGPYESLLLWIQIVLLVLYVIFTLFPPDIALFISPDTTTLKHANPWQYQQW